MADGSSVPIDEIELGDEVLAADPVTGEVGPRAVTRLIEGSGQKLLVEIVVDGESVVATDGHPVWVDGEGRWVDAVDVRPGDVLLTPDGVTTVDAVSVWSSAATVHNLTVDDLHTFFVMVGDDPVLTHNCSPGSGVPSAPQSVPSRQAAMLDADVGYNISPEAWFSEYPSIGRTGTFVTDGRGLADAFGGPINGSQRFTVGLTTNLDRGRVGFFRSRRIERSLGLERGSLRNGFRVTEIPGISSMSPRSPLTGNQFFRGPGQGLPNGAPELVVDSIKTVPWPP